MTFDGQHKPGDANAGKPTPSGEPAFNGHDLLNDHARLVGKSGDHKVAGNPNFEVADNGAAATAGKDAAVRRVEVATLTGGDPSKPDALQASREQTLATGQALIANISTPEQGHALMGQFNQQTADIQARIAAIAAIQKQYA